MSLSIRFFRRTVFLSFFLLSGLCAAQQQSTPQFNVPEVELTYGRVTSLLAGSFQPSGTSADIFYIDAATVSGTVSSVTAGELLNNQGFTNYNFNRITFTDVSDVVATLGDFNSDGHTDYAFALTPSGSNKNYLCVYYGTGLPLGNSSYNGGSIPNAYPPVGGESGCMTFQVYGSLPPVFSYIAGASLVNGQPPALILEDSANNYLYILANNGQTGVNGTLTGFTIRSTIALNPADGAGPLYIGDFNHDGNIDFIVNGQTGNSATVYFGNGAGGLLAQSRYTFSNNVHSMLMQDMDGDRIPDMVVEGDKGIIEVHKGNGTTVNTFALNSEGGTAAGANGFSGNGGHLVAIDPNTLNILTTTPIGLSVLERQGGSPPFNYVLKAIYDIGPGRSSFALASILGNGVLDLAVDSPEGVAIAPGDGNGGFVTSQAFTTLQPALSATVGKFRNAPSNPKGYLDVVAATGATQAQLLTGNGDGTFNTFPTVTNTSGGPSGIPASVWSNILSGDFNGDGKLDILYSLTGLPQPPPSSPPIVIYSQDGNGDGTFGSALTYIYQNSTGNNDNSYVETAVGDFNGDGITDFAFSNAVIDQSELSQSNFGIFLGFAHSDSNNTQLSQVATGFFKTGRTNQQDVVFQQGASFIPFKNPQDLTGKNYTQEPALTGAAAPYYPATVLLADVDGDGNGDLVVVYYNSAYNPVDATQTTPNQVYIWWGNGDGTFNATPLVLTVNRNYYLGAVADMNGDGLPDLVLSDGSLVGILYNQGGRSFGTEEHFLAGQGINSLSIQDVNGDGKPDLIVANGGATISNAVALGGRTASSLSLAANPDVNTGGITALLNNATSKPTSGTLAASPEPSIYPTSFTLTATLTPSPGVPPPTGPVNFSIDGAFVGSSQLVPGTTTSSATWVVPAGNGYASGTVHTLTANYQGDPYNSPITLSGSHNILGGSTTTSIFMCVGPTAACPAPPGAPGTFPPYSPSLTMYYGQIWNGYIQVVSNGGGTPTGNLELIDTYTGAAPAPPNPICTLVLGVTPACPISVGTTQGTSVGLNVLTGYYPGDAINLPSTSLPTAITVLPDTTTATLAGTPASSPAGQPVTFTVTVTGNYAAPNGPVAFTYGTTALCPPANLVPSATGLSSTATCTTSALPVGTDTVTASYAATMDFGAASATFQETITQPGAPSFTIAVTPNPVTLGVGNGAVLTVTVAPLNGFSQGVNLGCANLPTEATCSFANPAIAAGGGSTTLILDTAAPHSCGSTQPYFNSASGMTPFALPALAGLFMIFVPGKRRWLRALLAVVVAAGAVQIVGCGNCTDLGTRPATYTIQITGSAASGPAATQSQPVTLNVTI
jgi:hypothetical protein